MEIKEIQKPVFYITVRYIKPSVTGHMIAADDLTDALRIAEKYNISNPKFGEVRARRGEFAMDKHPLLPGRRIWYESNGQLQSWTVSR